MRVAVKELVQWVVNEIQITSTERQASPMEIEEPSLYASGVSPNAYRWGEMRTMIYAEVDESPKA